MALPSGEFKFLQLFRPSTVDLILTKMMRNDPEDLADIRFLMEQAVITPSVLDSAFLSSTRTEIPELEAAFESMKPIVHKIALTVELLRMDKSVSQSSIIPLDADWWSKLANQTSIEKEIERDRGIGP